MVDPRALAEDSLIEEEFLRELKANGMADNTLHNYRKAVNTLEDLEKAPSEMTKKDMIEWSAKLEDRLAESLISTYKACVKRYIKWLHRGDLDGAEYPECVKWMKTSSSSRNLPGEILSHKEIKQMAEVAENQRDRTMIWVGYESGCRPGELLGLKIKDVAFDKYGSQITVDGKAGERRIRLVEGVPDLKLWLSMHPEKDDPEAFLWPSRMGGSLSNPAWYVNLRKYAKKAGVKKHVYPHLLRHSRATHLTAEGINEAQLREIFGWSKKSDMPSIYVHLSGRDTDASILNLYGIDVKSSENQLETGIKECPYCRHENSPNAKFCGECNGPLDAVAAGKTDERMRERDELTKKIVRRLIDRAPEVVEEILREEEISSEVQRLGRSEATA